MANSVYSYVKQFELSDCLLPATWIVCRLDGHNFHSFSQAHKWTKPNDHQALLLMNAAATAVMHAYPDIILAIGMSDEYSFILPPSCTLYSRRREKISSRIVSTFTANYIFQWPHFFSNTPLLYPPSFDARCICYPTDSVIKDYLCWRQVDTHINNLYNTAYWALIQKGGITPGQAHARLDKTESSDKNEILFSEFGINYNNEPAMYRKGSILIWDINTTTTTTTTTTTIETTPPPPTTTTATIQTAVEEQQQEHQADNGNTDETPAQTLAQSSSSASPCSSTPRRGRVIALHEDIISPAFFVSHPGLIPHLTRTDRKKQDKQIKKQQSRPAEQQSSNNQHNIQSSINDLKQTESGT